MKEMGKESRCKKGGGVEKGEEERGWGKGG